MTRSGSRAATGLSCRDMPYGFGAMRSTKIRSAFCLGLDGFRHPVEGRVASCGEGYPPYNVESLQPTSERPAILRLIFAVAGFAPHQLDVFVTDRHLVIKGEQKGACDDRQFLHRGIAARRFERAFLLDDGLEVLGADLTDGLLSIELSRRAESEASATIRIGARDG